MKAVIRFIAAHNFLPILIAFVCYRFFSTLNHQAIDYFFALGASFFCWLFYWFDKLMDNKNKTFEPSDRHYLSDADKKIQWLVGVVLALLTICHFHTFPLKNLLVFSIAIPLSLFYLLIANSSKKMVKEIFSSLIIASTLCLIPIALNHEFYHLFVFPLFFLMVLGNIILLGIVDRAYDLKHQFNSISITTNQRFVKPVLIILMILMMLLSIYIGDTKYILWVSTYSLLYVAILIFRKKCDANFLHVLADAIFLFPLIFSIFI